MHAPGADGPVRAVNPGNAGGAKGLDTLADDMRSTREGRTVWRTQSRMQRPECKSRMRREFHVRFRESGGVKFPSATRPPILLSLAVTETARNRMGGLRGLGG